MTGMLGFSYGGFVRDYPPDNGEPNARAFAVVTDTRVTPIIPCDSTVIAGLGYRCPRTRKEKSKNIVVVVFHGGAVYEYKGVPFGTILELLSCQRDGLGSFYNLMIKGKYQCVKIQRTAHQPKTKSTQPLCTG